jgi:hypothetical protein
MLLLVMVAPSQILAYCGGRNSSVKIAAVLGAVLWVVGAVILSLRKTTRHEQRQGMGRLRSCVGSLCAIMPAALAAMFLLAVVSLGPLQHAWRQYEEVERTIVEQGEVAYWGMNAESQQEYSAGRRSR